MKIVKEILFKIEISFEIVKKNIFKHSGISQDFYQDVFYIHNSKTNEPINEHAYFYSVIEAEDYLNKHLNNIGRILISKE